MSISPYAGKAAERWMLTNIPRLITAYFVNRPDPAVPEHRVAFGTSGHRGSSLDNSFNEHHILAISQAICLYRREQGIDGPLFLGVDTHALSEPAFATALEVLAAGGVNVMLDSAGGYTPTPVISHAILTYNRGRARGLSDGIVITPSHNPPRFGGFKYNPPRGGPAGAEVTRWIEQRANGILSDGLRDVSRIPFERALKVETTHRHDYIDSYVGDLPSVVDMKLIGESRVRLGADPLGGASVAYYDAIAERYRLALDVVSHDIDPTFRFMTVDWDGEIRMDPSSSYAMAKMIDLRERFDVAFASDADADRHGIVSRSQGLMPPNNYLAVAIDYLFASRTHWPQAAGVGKTVVSSAMIDRVAARMNRKLVEVPVGFKWFVDGLLDSSLGFGGEESAGASFLRTDGSVWTTDKDGIIPNLLAAEITARTGKDPGEHYLELIAELGATHYTRVDAPATQEQKAKLAKLSPDAVRESDLAGDPITARLVNAPGNNAPIGGLKVVSAGGWFAARPSGTEDIYKIYAESFKDEKHLEALVGEARRIVDNAMGG
ncbi:MAG: phosphoglucomutase (alpha-D-glucose-1,6-bisphosphate-dependent) [Syntrophobacteraceae bacterium]|nr:phosphoglucomutase (alpha-D-glucose-1,6-bisphosphate-dependent) [Syntrophobacteraceae bacterium]